MDHRNETFSALRRKIRSLQPNLPGAGVHRCAAHLDVSDLSAAVVGRQTERYPSPGTGKNTQACACRARACVGELESQKVTKLKRAFRPSSFNFLTF
jgi:hypothetical protein